MWQQWFHFSYRISRFCDQSRIMFYIYEIYVAWWHHQMEAFSALLAICAGNSPVTGEFPAQRPMARSFDVFFDLRLNKRLSKQLWGWWFETLSRPLWRHSNGIMGWCQLQFIPWNICIRCDGALFCEWPQQDTANMYIFRGIYCTNFRMNFQINISMV